MRRPSTKEEPHGLTTGVLLYFSVEHVHKHYSSEGKQKGQGAFMSFFFFFNKMIHVGGG